MKKKHGNMVKRNTKAGMKESTLKIWMWAGWAVAFISTVALIVFVVYDVGGNGNDAHLLSGDSDPMIADFDFSDFEPPPPIILDNTTVATLNGINIGADDVGFLIQEAQWTMDGEHLDMFSNEWERAVREEAVRLAAMDILFAEYAAQNGIILPESEIFMLNSEIDQMEMQWGAEDFDAMLRGDAVQGRTHLQRIFYSFALTEEVINTIISDPDKFAVFERYMEEWDEIPAEELLAAKHILIRVEDFESDEEAMLFASEIHARALAGEDFDMLRAEYDQDLGQPPEGYTFASGVMVYEFEQATRGLEIGAISEPVMAFHGIHIILRTEPDANNAMLPTGMPTRESRMMEAIHRGFEAKLAVAEIELFPALDDIPIW